jgi:hypothetical protein
MATMGNDCSDACVRGVDLRSARDALRSGKLGTRLVLNHYPREIADTGNVGIGYDCLQPSSFVKPRSVVSQLFSEIMRR